MLMKEKIVLLDAGTIGKDIPWPDFSKLGDFKSYDNSSHEEALKRCRDASIILTNKVQIDQEIIDGAPKLKYIGTVATGYNQVDCAYASQKGILVCNVPDYSTPAVAQHVFALILSLASGICLHAQAVANGEWAKSPFFCFWKKPLIELKGKTLGVVGYGSIGSAVAELGHHFGMNVIAYVPRPKEKPAYQPFSFTQDLKKLFSESDIVSLHCPLTEENTGMVDMDLLKTMKKTALIINSSRGPLIKSKDLSEALKKGIISGAGLDVVEVEPMKEDDPLHGAPNCLITPHIAWASAESRQRLMEKVYENIEKAIKGSPINLVNK